MTQERDDLLTWRLAAGFETQRELAEAAGLDISTVWLAENKRHIGDKTARKIINVLRSRGLQVKVKDIDWNVSE